MSQQDVHKSVQEDLSLPLMFFALELSEREKKEVLSFPPAI